jgi:glyoxylase-like metal-dependent hydrolase (beta-lactamase superfamily II)
MYELIQITDHNYYVDSPTKVGIYESAPGNVWLIDSGSDKDAGKKVWKHIQEQGWTVEGILLTHAHADHVGGAKLLMERSGCRAFANGRECCFARYTTLEPALLYGGYPPNALRNKFLVAAAIPCEDIGDAPLPEGMKIYELSGHSPEMCGVRTPEGVFYCGDVVSSAATLEKYHINYIFDVREALDCLEGLPLVDARWFLPAHAALTTEILPLAKLNRDKLLEIIDAILCICRRPTGFEDILATLVSHYGLKLDFNQYVLVGSTVRSYLAYLLDMDRLRAAFTENRMLWAAAEGEVCAETKKSSCNSCTL